MTATDINKKCGGYTVPGGTWEEFQKQFYANLNEVIRMSVHKQPPKKPTKKKGK